MDYSKRFVFSSLQNAPKPYETNIRNEFIIHYVFKGKGTFHCGGKDYKVNTGESFMIHPFQLISYEPDPNDPWGYTWVLFDSPQIEALLSQIAFKEDKYIIGYIPPEKILPLFEHLVSIVRNKNTSSTMTKHGLAHTIVGVYIDSFPKLTLSPSDRLYEQALSLITSNYRFVNFNVDSLAAQLNISTSTLYRLFIEKSKISPNAYINNFRIERAQKMLESALPIKQVAFSCGFSDQFYFSKVFKKITGKNPSQYM